MSWLPIVAVGWGGAPLGARCGLPRRDLDERSFAVCGSAAVSGAGKLSAQIGSNDARQNDEQVKLALTSVHELTVGSTQRDPHNTREIA
jgi:hypothetical protein